jgi:hypothetical protein
VSEMPRLWHVRVTVAGPPMEPLIVKRAMQRLAGERPFLASLRYSADRAEISFWDEAATLVDAGSLALRLWSEHRESANLPPWEVVGLEVLERDVHVVQKDLDSLLDLHVVPLLPL